MRLLTRAEEYVLLAVLRLGEEAYSLPILEFIENTTEKKWTLGGIYIPLYRLEEKGFLRSELGSPTREGGEAKEILPRHREGQGGLENPSADPNGDAG